MVYQHIEYAKSVGGTNKLDLHLKELITIALGVLRGYHSIPIKRLAKLLT
jgi:hypothetical protein